MGLLHSKDSELKISAWWITAAKYFFDHLLFVQVQQLLLYINSLLMSKEFDKSVVRQVIKF